MEFSFLVDEPITRKDVVSLSDKTGSPLFRSPISHPLILQDTKQSCSIVIISDSVKIG